MRREQGFALAAVLVLLVGAATVAGAAQISARADADISETTARRLILASAIDGSIALAMADLQDTQSARGPSLNGAQSAIYQIGDVKLELRALASTGQVNINIATEEEIAAALNLSGIGAAKANQIAYEIHQRREDQSYTHIVEARSEFGDDGAAFRRAAPLFTTRSDIAIDLRLAPTALAALLKRAGLLKDETTAPEAVLAEGSVVTFFVFASLPAGSHMSTARTVAISDSGQLLWLEDAPFDRLSIDAVFGEEE